MESGHYQYGEFNQETLSIELEITGVFHLKKKKNPSWMGAFLGCPMVKIPCSLCRGPEFDPKELEPTCYTQIKAHMLKLKATKTQCS